MPYVRLVHALPGAANVDIYINKVKVVSNLAYSEVTAYLCLETKSTRQRVVVMPVGGDTAIVKATVASPTEYTTVVICMNGEEVTVQAYTDDNKVDKQGVAVLRLIHLVNGAPNVNMIINSSVLLEDVAHLSAKRRKLGLGLPSYSASVVLNIPGGATIYGPETISPANQTVHTLFLMGTMDDVTGIFVLDNNAINDKFATDFNLQSYMGTWNVIAEIPQSYLPPGTAHQDAVYTHLHNHIKIFNTAYNSENVPISSITGVGVVPNPDYPAALRIVYEGITPVSEGPNYLVHKYYKSATDGYAYVGSSNRASYYLLSRSTCVPDRTYDRFIYIGSKLGYNTSKVVRYDSPQTK